MPWVAPRTWVTGEVVTASIANQQWRDNMLAVATKVHSPHYGPTRYNPITTNEAWFVRVEAQAGFAVTSFELNLGVSSGNIDVGLYSDVAGAPSERLWSRGSFASPGIGQRSILISAGSPTSLTFSANVVWLAIAADNANVTFAFAAAGFLPKGIVKFKALSFPLPASVSGLTEDVDTGPSVVLL